jgi:hypothetical protein
MHKLDAPCVDDVMACYERWKSSIPPFLASEEPMSAHVTCTIDTSICNKTFHHGMYVVKVSVQKQKTVIVSLLRQGRTAHHLFTLQVRLDSRNELGFIDGLRHVVLSARGQPINDVLGPRIRRHEYRGHDIIGIQPPHLPVNRKSIT